MPKLPSLSETLVSKKPALTLSSVTPQQSQFKAGTRLTAIQAKVDVTKFALKTDQLKNPLASPLTQLIKLLRAKNDANKRTSLNKAKTFENQKLKARNELLISQAAMLRRLTQHPFPRLKIWPAFVFRLSAPLIMNLLLTESRRASIEFKRTALRFTLKCRKILLMRLQRRPTRVSENVWSVLRPPSKHTLREQRWNKNTRQVSVENARQLKRSYVQNLHTQRHLFRRWLLRFYWYTRNALTTPRRNARAGVYSWIAKYASSTRHYARTGHAWAVGVASEHWKKVVTRLVNTKHVPRAPLTHIAHGAGVVYRSGVPKPRRERRAIVQQRSVLVRRLVDRKHGNINLRQNFSKWRLQQIKRDLHALSAFYQNRLNKFKSHVPTAPIFEHRAPKTLLQATWVQTKSVLVEPDANSRVPRPPTPQHPSVFLFERTLSPLLECKPVPLQTTQKQRLRAKVARVFSAVLTRFPRPSFHWRAPNIIRPIALRSLKMWSGPKHNLNTRKTKNMFQAFRNPKGLRWDWYEKQRFKHIYMRSLRRHWAREDEANGYTIPEISEPVWKSVPARRRAKVQRDYNRRFKSRERKIKKMRTVPLSFKRFLRRCRPRIRRALQAIARWRRRQYNRWINGRLWKFGRNVTKTDYYSLAKSYRSCYRPLEAYAARRKRRLVVGVGRLRRAQRLLAVLPRHRYYGYSSRMPKKATPLRHKTGFGFKGQHSRAIRRGQPLDVQHYRPLRTLCPTGSWWNRIHRRKQAFKKSLKHGEHYSAVKICTRAHCFFSRAGLLFHFQNLAKHFGKVRALRVIKNSSYFSSRKHLKAYLKKNVKQGAYKFFLKTLKTRVKIKKIKATKKVKTLIMTSNRRAKKKTKKVLSFHLQFFYCRPQKQRLTKLVKTNGWIRTTNRYSSASAFYGRKSKNLDFVNFQKQGARSRKRKTLRSQMRRHAHGRTKFRGMGWPRTSKFVARDLHSKPVRVHPLWLKKFLMERLDNAKLNRKMGKMHEFNRLTNTIKHPRRKIQRRHHRKLRHHWKKELRRRQKRAIGGFHFREHLKKVIVPSPSNPLLSHPLLTVARQSLLRTRRQLRAATPSAVMMYGLKRRRKHGSRRLSGRPGHMRRRSSKAKRYALWINKRLQRHNDWVRALNQHPKRRRRVKKYWELLWRARIKEDDREENSSRNLRTPQKARDTFYVDYRRLRRHRYRWVDLLRRQLRRKHGISGVLGYRRRQRTFRPVLYNVGYARPARVVGQQQSEALRLRLAGNVLLHSAAELLTHAQTARHLQKNKLLHHTRPWLPTRSEIRHAYRTAATQLRWARYHRPTQKLGRVRENWQAVEKFIHPEQLNSQFSLTTTTFASADNRSSYRQGQILFSKFLHNLKTHEFRKLTQTNFETTLAQNFDKTTTNFEIETTLATQFNRIGPRKESASLATMMAEHITKNFVRSLHRKSSLLAPHAATLYQQWMLAAKKYHYHENITHLLATSSVYTDPRLITLRRDRPRFRYIGTRRLSYDRAFRRHMRRRTPTRYRQKRFRHTRVLRVRTSSNLRKQRALYQLTAVESKQRQRMYKSAQRHYLNRSWRRLLMYRKRKTARFQLSNDVRLVATSDTLWRLAPNAGSYAETTNTKKRFLNLPLQLLLKKRSKEHVRARFLSRPDMSAITEPLLRAALARRLVSKRYRAWRSRIHSRRVGKERLRSLRYRAYLRRRNRRRYYRRARYSSAAERWYAPDENYWDVVWLSAVRYSRRKKRVVRHYTPAGRLLRTSDKIVHRLQRRRPRRGRKRMRHWRRNKKKHPAARVFHKHAYRRRNVRNRPLRTINPAGWLKHRVGRSLVLKNRNLSELHNAKKPHRKVWKSIPLLRSNYHRRWADRKSTLFAKGMYRIKRRLRAAKKRASHNFWNRRHKKQALKELMETEQRRERRIVRNKKKSPKIGRRRDINNKVVGPLTHWFLSGRKEIKQYARILRKNRKERNKAADIMRKTHKKSHFRRFRLLVKNQVRVLRKRQLKVRKKKLQRRKNRPLRYIRRQGRGDLRIRVQFAFSPRYRKRRRLRRRTKRRYEKVKVRTKMRSRTRRKFKSLLFRPNRYLRRRVARFRRHKTKKFRIYRAHRKYSNAKLVEKIRKNRMRGGWRRNTQKDWYTSHSFWRGKRQKKFLQTSPINAAVITNTDRKFHRGWASFRFRAGRRQLLRRRWQQWKQRIVTKKTTRLHRRRSLTRIKNFTQLRQQFARYRYHYTRLHKNGHRIWAVLVNKRGIPWQQKQLAHYLSKKSRRHRNVRRNILRRLHRTRFIKKLHQRPGLNSGVLRFFRNRRVWTGLKTTNAVKRLRTKRPRHLRRNRMYRHLKGLRRAHHALYQRRPKKKLSHLRRRARKLNSLKATVRSHQIKQTGVVAKLLKKRRIFSLTPLMFRLDLKKKFALTRRQKREKARARKIRVHFEYQQQAEIMDAVTALLPELIIFLIQKKLKAAMTRTQLRTALRSVYWGLKYYLSVQSHARVVGLTNLKFQNKLNIMKNELQQNAEERHFKRKEEHETRVRMQPYRLSPDANLRRNKFIWFRKVLPYFYDLFREDQSRFRRLYLKTFEFYRIHPVRGPRQQWETRAIFRGADYTFKRLMRLRGHDRRLETVHITASRNVRAVAGLTSKIGLLNWIEPSSEPREHFFVRSFSTFSADRIENLDAQQLALIQLRKQRRFENVIFNNFYSPMYYVLNRKQAQQRAVARGKSRNLLNEDNYGTMDPRLLRDKSPRNQLYYIRKRRHKNWTRGLPRLRKTYTEYHNAIVARSLPVGVRHSTLRSARTQAFSNPGTFFRPRTGIRTVPMLTRLRDEVALRRLGSSLRASAVRVKRENLHSTTRVTLAEPRFCSVRKRVAILRHPQVNEITPILKVAALRNAKLTKKVVQTPRSILHTRIARNRLTFRHIDHRPKLSFSEVRLQQWARGSMTATCRFKKLQRVVPTRFLPTAVSLKKVSDHGTKDEIKNEKKKHADVKTTAIFEEIKIAGLSDQGAAAQLTELVTWKAGGVLEKRRRRFWSRVHPRSVRLRRTRTAKNVDFARLHPRHWLALKRLHKEKRGRQHGVTEITELERKQRRELTKEKRDRNIAIKVLKKKQKVVSNLINMQEWLFFANKNFDARLFILAKSAFDQIQAAVTALGKEFTDYSKLVRTEAGFRYLKKHEVRAFEWLKFCSFSYRVSALKKKLVTYYDPAYFSLAPVKTESGKFSGTNLKDSVLVSTLYNYKQYYFFKEVYRLQKTIFTTPLKITRWDAFAREWQRDLLLANTDEAKKLGELLEVLHSNNYNNETQFHTAFNRAVGAMNARIFPARVEAKLVAVVKEKKEETRVAVELRLLHLTLPKMKKIEFLNIIHFWKKKFCLAPNLLLPAEKKLKKEIAQLERKEKHWNNQLVWKTRRHYKTTRLFCTALKRIKYNNTKSVGRDQREELKRALLMWKMRRQMIKENYKTKIAAVKEAQMTLFKKYALKQKPKSVKFKPWGTRVLFLQKNYQSRSRRLAKVQKLVTRKTFNQSLRRRTALVHVKAQQKLRLARMKTTYFAKHVHPEGLQPVLVRFHRLWDLLTNLRHKKLRLLKTWLHMTSARLKRCDWKYLSTPLYKKMRARLKKLEWRDQDERFELPANWRKKRFAFRGGERKRMPWLEHYIYPRTLYRTRRSRNYRRDQAPGDTKHRRWLQYFRRSIASRRRPRGIYIRNRRWPKLRTANYRFQLSMFDLRHKRAAQRRFDKMCRRWTAKESRLARYLRGHGNRLDVTLILMNIAPSPYWARQMAPLGLIRVNGKIISDSEYRLQPGDLIQPLYQKIKKLRYFFRPWRPWYKKDRWTRTASTGIAKNMKYFHKTRSIRYERLPRQGDVPKNNRFNEFLYLMFRLDAGRHHKY